MLSQLAERLISYVNLLFTINMVAT